MEKRGIPWRGIDGAARPEWSVAIVNGSPRLRSRNTRNPSNIESMLAVLAVASAIAFG